MKNPLTEIPVARAVVTFSDGTVYDESWTIATIGEAPEFLRPGSGGGPPSWLFDTGRDWRNPQDPVTVTGRVEPGREAEAREALGIVDA